MKESEIEKHLSKVTGTKDEIPPHEASVKALISSTNGEKGAHPVLKILTKRPLGLELPAIKSLIFSHRLMCEGIPQVVQDFAYFRQFFCSMTELYNRNIRADPRRYTVMIFEYSKFFIEKIEFHQQQPSVTPNYDINHFNSYSPSPSIDILSPILEKTHELTGGILNIFNVSKKENPLNPIFVCVYELIYNECIRVINFRNYLFHLIYKEGSKKSSSSISSLKERYITQWTDILLFSHFCKPYFRTNELPNSPECFSEIQKVPIPISSPRQQSTILSPRSSNSQYTADFSSQSYPSFQPPPSSSHHHTQKQSHSLNQNQQTFQPHQYQQQQYQNQQFQQFQAPQHQYQYQFQPQLFNQQQPQSQQSLNQQQPQSQQHLNQQSQPQQFSQTSSGINSQSTELLINQIQQQMMNRLSADIIQNYSQKYPTLSDSLDFLREYDKNQNQNSVNVLNFIQNFCALLYSSNPIQLHQTHLPQQTQQQQQDSQPILSSSPYSQNPFSTQVQNQPFSANPFTSSPQQPQQPQSQQNPFTSPTQQHHPPPQQPQSQPQPQQNPYSQKYQTFQNNPFQNPY